MIRALVFATAVAVAPVAASASMIDFETLPDTSTPTGNTIAVGPLTYGFGAGNSVTFSSTLDLALVKVGGPTNGFVPNDTPDPSDAFGDYFLSTQLAKASDLKIDYLNPVRAFTFDLGDVDGRQDDVSGGTKVENFLISVFDDADQLLTTRVVTGDDPGAGDRSVINVAYDAGSNRISHILIDAYVGEGASVGQNLGNRNIGIAFDNFDADATLAPVPVPAGLPLMIGGLGALAWLRRRKQG